VRELGPPVDTQGVRAAASCAREKLLDLDAEIYERDEPG
jgi:uncharacterized protein (DUF2164 family)